MLYCINRHLYIMHYICIAYIQVTILENGIVLRTGGPGSPVLRVVIPYLKYERVQVVNIGIDDES